MASMKQAQAALVRAVLCLHFVLVVWRVTESWTEQYWLMLAAILPFLLEALFTIFRRDGVEWKLFSVCFFFYLCATLPGIWLLEIHKTQVYQSGNFTQVDDIVISGVEIPIRLNSDTWVLVVEELMLYLMILGRWVLPRGDVGREQLTQLLFGFIGIASDIMELFSLFDEDPKIRHNTTLIYVILSVWSVSVLQFTLTFVTAHRPRRSRGLRMSPSMRSNGDLDPDDDLDPRGDQEHRHRLSVLRVELLATVLSLLMQDGPFLCVRLFTIIRYNVLTYSLVFFTSKNVLVILLLVYKIFLLLFKICCPTKHRHKDEKEDLDHVHPNQDSVRTTPKLGRGSLEEGEPEHGDLRKRREWKGDYGDFSDLGTGDLQMAIEGPATPAKSMERTKKYKQMVQDDTAETGAESSKDAENGTEENGIENPAFEPSPHGSREELPTGRKESLEQNENPGRKKSRGWNDPSRKESVGLNGEPGRKESLGQNENPGRKESLGQNENPSRRESLGQNEDPERMESLGQNRDPERIESRGQNEDPGRKKSLGQTGYPGRKESSGENEDDGKSKSHGWSDPIRKESLGQKEDPIRSESIDSKEDPDRNKYNSWNGAGGNESTDRKEEPGGKESQGSNGSGRKDSHGQKDPGRKKSQSKMEAPTDMSSSEPSQKPKKHVSVIKIKL